MGSPSNEKYAETMMNLMLLDPPRWGWTAMGGVADLLPPHERARRKESKKAFLNAIKRQREKSQAPSTLDNAAPLQPSAAEKSQSALDPNAKAFSTGSAQATSTTEKQPDAHATSNSPAQRINNESQSQATLSGKEIASGAVLTESDLHLPNNCEPHSTTAKTVPPEGTSPKGRVESATNTSQKVKKENEQIPPISDRSNNQSGLASHPAPGRQASQASELIVQGNAQPSNEGNAATQPADHQPVLSKCKPTNSNDGVTPLETSVDAGTAVSNQHVLSVKALREDGSLDIYAYHRGREGMEPRIESTGELLCDVPQTDSNYKLDEPKLSLQVVVSFPLDDEDPSDIKWFEETINWDLANPETPTPMAFAAITAEDFGLSFGQTIDLATSIQNQIDRHISEHCSYAVPVAMTDGAGTSRTNFPPHEVYYLYGAVCEIATPGTKVKGAITAPRSKSKASNRASSGSTSRRNPGVNSASSRPVAPPPTYFDEPVDDAFLEETRKRMIQHSRDHVAAASTQLGWEPGRLIMRINHVCHICHKRHNLVGQFCCGYNAHSYCAMHLEARLGVTVRSVSDQVSFDHCPICAVSCQCAKCNRRLNALAIELKKRSEAQGGAEPINTNFDDLFTCWTKPKAGEKLHKEMNASTKQRESISSMASENEFKPKAVPKVEKPKQPQVKAKRKSITKNAEAGSPRIRTGKANPLDFPREVRGGRDVDPGTAIDYLTVYTAEGRYVTEPDLSKMVAPKASNNPDLVIEDGNVDYCHKCRKHGNLVCCDYCPRAFHEKCLAGNGNEHGSKWECPVCCREKEDLPEYKLTGMDSQALISAAYNGLKSTTDDDLRQISVLSKMHEMIEKLMNGEFGGLFAVPVDCKVVTDYLKFIHRPMDLGTIGAKLLNGTYKKFFEANRSWDDIHSAVLMDIELVFQNCFTYNQEGSSIYRMAEVLRRRMLGMRMKSLDNDLSVKVRKKVEEYARSKTEERSKIPPSIDLRPRSRYTFSAPAQKGGNGTKVAVLDPATGMVVKIYTTVNAASLAAENMESRGHRGEFAANINSVKSLVKRSVDDVTATLFGYRWLCYNKLRNGEVAFPETTRQVYEMIDGESSTIYMSLDEALSDPRLPSHNSQRQLRKTLLDLPSRGETTFAGLKWRRLDSDRKEVMLSSYWTDGTTVSIDSASCLASTATIAKEDIVLGRTLGGYDTLDAAFEDWVRVCRTSPSVPEDEISRPTFHTYYLDGDRNVDGIIWKTIERAAVQSDDDSHHEVEKSVDAEERTQVTTETTLDPRAVTGHCHDFVIANGPGDTATEVVPEHMVGATESPPQREGNTREEMQSNIAAPATESTKKRERSDEELLLPRKK